MAKYGMVIDLDKCKMHRLPGLYGGLEGGK